jgi:aminoglycoside 6-adenylyltransferase
MRTEQEMMELIGGFAANDERIRVIIMNGSRVNPAAPRDIFQDYDIVYVVNAVEDFTRDRSWISHFGDILIMQTPDENVLFPAETKDSFGFLMLFTDGNRIDLTFCPVARMGDFHTDSLSLLLLDKDGIAEPFPPPSNRDYLPVAPTEKQFSDCCNEFWWVSTYTAKGLWREELSYANYMLERPVRDMLALMLNWFIGIRTDFSADPGKLGKFYERYLEPDQWKAFVRTFPDGDYQNMWQSLFVMCGLFRETGAAVAEHLGYVYPIDMDTRVTAYLKQVKHLPKDAAGFE